MEKNNKRFFKNQQSTVRDGFMEHSRSAASILPSPAILESYEEIAPGMVEQLVEMVKAEQKHRQGLENKYAKTIVITAQIGQILSFMLVIAILFATVIAFEKSLYLSLAICFIGFTFLLIVKLNIANKHNIYRKFKPESAQYNNFYKKKKTNKY